VDVGTSALRRVFRVGHRVAVPDVVDHLPPPSADAADSPAAQQPAAATQADTAAINELRQQEVTAVSTGDTTLAYMDENIVIMSPGQPVVIGLPAARTWLKDFLRQFRASVSYGNTTVMFAGDLLTDRRWITAERALPEAEAEHDREWRIRCVVAWRERTPERDVRSYNREIVAVGKNARREQRRLVGDAHTHAAHEAERRELSAGRPRSAQRSIQRKAEVAAETRAGLRVLVRRRVQLAEIRLLQLAPPRDQAQLIRPVHGIGDSSRPRITPYIAVFAPRPRPRDSTATSVKPGLRRSTRST
jgi:hypothetical protein